LEVSRLIGTSLKSSQLKYLLFSVLFFISGMTGLVYESVWTQYLKLLTGHAAFAQSFILVLFLFGLATGAWFGGKILKKVKNLFLLYAIIEFGIGILAIVFHPLFDQLNHFLFENLYPSYQKTWVDFIKWLFAILLTLPQTVLLGSTFPVMAEAFVRFFSEKKIKIVPHLYFINSMGASIGVLISGFYLTEKFGLPGSMLISGLSNILIALFSLFGTWFFKNPQTIIGCGFTRLELPSKDFLPEVRLQNKAFRNFILFAALLTGATSFVYEIGWIRMLSMALGSSAYAFELMLSAFILGIALGSFWIKTRINRINNVLTLFAIIQILMGVFAVMSISGYNFVFDLMAWLMESLQRNENGFLLFLTGSHFIAILVMLPATIFAGMSLPMLVSIMQRIDFKQDVVGKIYAIDTAGGIVGVLAATHVLLPFFGLKYLLIIGGSLDVLTGLIFYFLQKKVALSRWIIPSIAGFLVFLISAILFLNPDSQKMASGVFRYGQIANTKEILFEKDGKTATISVFQTQKGNIVLTTNGKPDASVNIYRQITGDETTQVLLAALPFSFNYRPQSVGIIGLGCGKTAHTALTNFNIKELDVVEIEPVVYEAAHFFKDYVNNIFIDSRFKLHINDARTYFSSSPKKYDLIISEPSNPWVSGIGSLFSGEFYDLINRNLTLDGIFVQWIHTYEMTVPLIASIIKSFSPHFQDYQVFFMDDGDLAIVAKKSGKLITQYTEIFENVELRHELARIGIESSHDFEIRLVGDKDILDPFFFSYPVSATSDYYPKLEYQATKAGFMQFSASNLIQLLNFPAPILPSLMKNHLPQGSDVAMNASYQHAEKFRDAEDIFKVFESLHKGKNPIYRNLKDETTLLVTTIRQIENSADSLNFPLSWTPFLPLFAKSVIPFLKSEKLDIIWDVIRNSDGFKTLPEKIRQQAQFYKAVGNKNFTEIIEMTEKSSFDEFSLSFSESEYFFTCRIWALLMLSKPDEAMKLYEKYPDQDDPPLMLRLLGNLAKKRHENS